MAYDDCYHYYYQMPCWYHFKWPFNYQIMHNRCNRITRKRIWTRRLIGWMHENVSPLSFLYFLYFHTFFCILQFFSSFPLIYSAFSSSATQLVEVLKKKFFSGWLLLFGTIIPIIIVNMNNIDIYIYILI